MKKDLTFGMMRLPVTSDGKVDIDETSRLADAFLERGFRRFDTAELYHDTMSEYAVHECLVKRHKREDFEIADKLSSWRMSEGMTAEEFFQRQLKVVGVDYFDRYLLHSVEPAVYEAAEKNGYFDFIFQKKAKGIVRQAGFSFHGSPELLEEVLTKYPEADFVQLQINYMDWDNSSVRAKECYDVARRHKKNIFVMEPVKGGMLADLSGRAGDILRNYAPERSVASWAIRFAAGLEGVESVLSGMSNWDQLLDNCETMSDFKALDDEELKVIGQVRAVLKSIPQIECTACNYCKDACPVELPISGYLKVLNNLRIYGAAAGVRNSYRWHTQKHQPSECVSCRCCVDVCPQHLDIPGHLEALAKLAGELTGK